MNNYSHVLNFNDVVHDNGVQLQYALAVEHSVFAGVSLGLNQGLKFGFPQTVNLSRVVMDT